jgi:hypothetical protein
VNQPLQPDFQSIALEHCSRYPELQVQDLYKLTHQAALGSEHAVKDIRTARQWLAREIDQLPDVSTERIIDPINPDQSIVRVHLKPYIDAGGDPERLLRSFIRTANEYKGSIELLKQYWKWIETSASCGELPFPPEVLDSMIVRMASLDFPAVHHSKQYKAAYAPHYRVIARRFLVQENLILDSPNK